MADILLIAGLSGAGRSQTADDLEDLGWFVVDNMPVALIDKVVELASTPGSATDRLALVVGVASQQADALEVLQRLRESGHRVRLVFLDAETPELVKRYASTRRKHPLAIGETSVEEAIERERGLLETVKGAADIVIDTTGMTIHQLRSRVGEAFGAGGVDEAMQLSVISFGYKHGIPIDVDWVFDARFLPNPHWDEALRPLTGLDEPVRRFVLDQPLAIEFLVRTEELFASLLPGFREEGRSYLTVAIGCTGGRHRSVALAEAFAGWLREQGHRPRVAHRDVAR